MLIALCIATFIATIAALVALELSAPRLPAVFAGAQAARLAELHALADRKPWLTHLSRAVVFGYLLTLIALGFDAPGAKYALLVLSIGWTTLSTLNAPNVQHRIAVPFYELSLLLNGALLAVAFTR